MKYHTGAQQGFTLVELMIVVAIIALLASIALPSYSKYVMRGHRAEARAGLLQAQRWLERAATARGSYPDTLPDVLSWKLGTPAAEGKRYIIGYEPDGCSGSGADAACTGYTLRAKPSTPAQQKDDCGDLTLKHTGEQGSHLAQTDATKEATVGCWRR